MASSKRAKRRRRKSSTTLRAKRKMIARLFDPRVIRARREAEVEAAFVQRDRCHHCGVRCDSYFEDDPAKNVCPECCYKLDGHDFRYDRYERCKVCWSCGARWSEVYPDDYDD